MDQIWAPHKNKQKIVPLLSVAEFISVISAALKVVLNHYLRKDKDQQYHFTEKNY